MDSKRNSGIEVFVCGDVCSHSFSSCNFPQHKQLKINKYKGTASQHQAKFIAFVIESTGGLSDSAVSLLKQILLASRDNSTLWAWEEVRKECFWSVGIAIQKGNAMAMIAGRNKAVGMGQAA